jgi:hypothetical protein
MDKLPSLPPPSGVRSADSPEITATREIGREIKIDIPVAFVLALFPFGYQMLGLTNSPAVGVASWLACAGLLGRILWVALAGKRFKKSIFIVLPAIIVLLVWKPVSSRFHDHAVDPVNPKPHPTPARNDTQAKDLTTKKPESNPLLLTHDSSSSNVFNDLYVCAEPGITALSVGGKKNTFNHAKIHTDCGTENNPGPGARP